MNAANIDEKKKKNLKENLLQSDRDLPLGRRVIFTAIAQKENPTKTVPEQQCPCHGKAKEKLKLQIRSVAGLKLFNYTPLYLKKMNEWEKKLHCSDVQSCNIPRHRQLILNTITGIALNMRKY